MKQKKIPIRSCVVTREKLEKKDLIRVVRTPNGNVEVDLTGKMNGRGAYIKRDIDVIEKSRKSKILDRTLEITVSDDVYEKLKNVINN